MFTHVRTAPPRYEVRNAGDGSAIPCTNTQHVTHVLHGLGVPLLSTDRIYTMVRYPERQRSLPAGLTVHKLTAEERATRPSFKITRTVE